MSDIGPTSDAVADADAAPPAIINPRPFRRRPRLFVGLLLFTLAWLGVLLWAVIHTHAH